MTRSNRDRDRRATRDDIERELEPWIEPGERQALLSIAARLAEERPVPAAGLRSAIRARLLGVSGHQSGSGVRALILAYGSTGAFLLALAAVGLAGIGPFAA